MLTIEQEVLVRALRVGLAGQKINIDESVDWKMLFKESISQAVSLISLQGIEPSCIPSEVKGRWQTYAMHSLTSNVELHRQHAYLHSLMREANIPYAILKGSVSAYYYPDPLMRAMGDVDFLVPETELKNGCEFLENKGFEKHPENHICHVVYKKGKVHLEMHFKPAGMPDGKAGQIMEEYFKDVFERSEPVNINGNEFIKPSAFHHGLILLMHTHHHLLSEGVGLRHLCDWAVFVNSFDDESFAEVFEDKLSKVGLWKFAQILSYISSKYLGITKKVWMGEFDEKFTQAVLEDILTGGNFGAKDQNRSAQGLSISNRGKGGVKRSKFLQLLSNLNKAGQTKYPKMAKIPIIKHFCIIPIGFRYCFRVLTGKRKKIDFFGGMQQAEARKQLYKNFELYEIKEKTN